MNRIRLARTGVAVDKFISLACPINDVLDFGGHFLSLDRDIFSKEGFFQQPRLIATVTLKGSGVHNFRTGAHANGSIRPLPPGD